MNTSIESRLKRLITAGQQHLLKGGLRGLEKESLRITPQGHIAQTMHPGGLGSALMHPYITTDYSEALIELITPPFRDSADTLGFLEDVHRFVYEHLGDELLWAASMPCDIEGEQSIPIADYGSSNVGRMKHIYRRGLAWRYGRAMQSIAGIHFNYSVNEAFWPVFQELLGNREDPLQFIADQYFGLIRNIHRLGWLILFLFGSSPAFSRSFFKGREGFTAKFQELDAHTLYRPYATSLRMSDIGYRNDSQSELDISFNNLDEYVSSLSKAITTPFPN
ncbi:MAG: glutamate--cysteine ligase, partial [Methylococcaceae bacterium]|nr:glutamate--cysteine ligase [Methylococcaceae bacterium]